MIFFFLLLLSAKAYGEEENGGAGGNGETASVICQSEECKEFGRSISESLDETQEPCTNFAKFSCGGRNKDQKPSMFSDIIGKEDEYVREELIRAYEESPVDNLYVDSVMKNMYKLCKNREAINSQGFEPLKEKLMAAGDWPILNPNWEGATWKFEEAELKLKQQGFEHGSIIEFRVVTDTDDNQKHILQVQKGKSLELFELDHLQEYKQSLIEVAQKWGLPENQAKESVENTFDYQRELVILKDKESKDDYTKLTLKELQSEVSWVEWNKLINGLIPNCVEVNEDETILLYNLEYFKAIENHIKNNKRGTANTMFWHAMTQIIDSKALPGIEIEGENERYECSADIYERFPLAFSYVYVHTYKLDENRDDAKTIVHNIQSQLLENIKELDWTDDELRENAKNKITNMIMVVGYPDELQDIMKIKDVYEGLTTHNENYALAILEYNKWKHDLSFKMLRKTMEETDVWEDSRTIVWDHLSYNSFENILNIHPSSLRPPYFYPHVPKYIDYAIFGKLVAGTLINSIAEELQYGTSVTYDMFDTETINLAYTAYKRNYPKENEKLSDNLTKYSENQMFWIVNAHMMIRQLRITEEQESDEFRESGERPRESEDVPEEDDSSSEESEEFNQIFNHKNIPQFMNDFGCYENLKASEIKEENHPRQN